MLMIKIILQFFFFLESIIVTVTLYINKRHFEFKLICTSYNNNKYLHIYKYTIYFSNLTSYFVLRVFILSLQKHYYRRLKV